MTSQRQPQPEPPSDDQLNQFGGLNAGYVADLIERYVGDPGSVPAPDRELLQSIDAALGRAVYSQPGGAAGSPAAGVDVRRLSRLLSYIDAIRNYGYRVARLDPLGLNVRREPLLDPATHGITEDDQSSSADPAVALAGGSGALKFGATAGDLIAALRRTYCGASGYEFSHIRSLDERAWLRNSVESGRYRSFITPDQKLKLLELLTRAEVFEQFLHKAFPGQRWYSLEGCEALVILTDQIVLQAAYSGIANVVVGMAHRGRLNLLTHLFGKPYEKVLDEFTQGHYSQEGELRNDRGWMTDVKYHMGARTTRDVDGDGATDITLTLLPNPSHLEMVNPVVAGAVRAIQDEAAANPANSAMGLMVHGDAAFAGQGIVAETLNMANLPGYRTGGTIHLLVNNQLGFTTEPHDSYSTEHASDLARGFEIPIVHVNADDIEACIVVAKLAIAYRQRFRKDFLIDLIGYRRYGHNETDEPAFTQPVMYRAIERHETTRAIWARTLEAGGAIGAGAADQMAAKLMVELQAMKEQSSDAGNGHRHTGTAPAPASPSPATVPPAALADLNARLNDLPAGFTPHPRISRVIERRREVFATGKGVDWAHAESLAFASLLRDGVSVRFAGQDSERGTFSQRHAVLHDYETGGGYSPFSVFGPGRFWVYNSPLSEQAAMAYEHGYSAQSRNTLTFWEAQFGDFVNNAQSVVDELVASAQAKWGQESGLVLLLPHGYEGQGANHSYAHLHRFLALGADNNLTVANPTTAAQYFHLLRRQAAQLGAGAVPLIVMAPKSLLRHPLASSAVADLSRGTFQDVLFTPAPAGDTGSKRLVLCSGKVYSDLVASEHYLKAPQTDIVRIEQLYPFPQARLQKTLAGRKYGETVWLQEESQNRGAWAYVAQHLEGALGASSPIRYVGRPPMPSPAEGAHWMHKAMQESLVKRALGVAA